MSFWTTFVAFLAFDRGFLSTTGPRLPLKALPTLVSVGGIAGPGEAMGGFLGGFNRALLHRPVAWLAEFYRHDASTSPPKRS